MGHCTGHSACSGQHIITVHDDAGASIDIAKSLSIPRIVRDCARMQQGEGARGGGSGSGGELSRSAGAIEDPGAAAPAWQYTKCGLGQPYAGLDMNSDRIAMQRQLAPPA